MNKKHEEEDEEKEAVQVAESRMEKVRTHAVWENAERRRYLHCVDASRRNNIIVRTAIAKLVPSYWFDCVREKTETAC